MFRPLRLLALLASCLAGVVVTMTVQPGTAAAPRWTPPPDTIVRVIGTAEEGFAIHFHDGSALFPPTDSEARAECAELRRQTARTRCWTEVRTWYRDLADLKQALRLAHQS